MKQIIIAEDDPGIRDIFKIILQRAGYAVTVLESAELLLNNEYALPDLFIVDKQLSGIDGIEVCHHLKNEALTKHIPVIMMSASPYVAKFAEEAGADGFLEKPFEKKLLIELMEKCLNN